MDLGNMFMCFQIFRNRSMSSRGISCVSIRKPSGRQRVVWSRACAHSCVVCTVLAHDTCVCARRVLPAHAHEPKGSVRSRTFLHNNCHYKNKRNCSLSRRNNALIMNLKPRRCKLVQVCGCKQPQFVVWVVEWTTAHVICEGSSVA